MTLLFILHFAGLISDSVSDSLRQLSNDEARIQNFPFSLHKSTSINGTIRKGHLNIHYANFEQSNVLDLLRVHVRLHDVNKFVDRNKLSLQVTCQHPIDAISFALPTKSGDIEDGVILPGLDMETTESLFDNRSIYLFILVTTNSNNILTYSISIKIYDRAQYSVILRAPKFSRALLNQKISAMMPLAFRIHISNASIQMFKVAVKSNDNYCALMVVQNYSTAFLHSGMLASSSSIRVAFTRKASLMLLANSPLHVFVIMMYDDLICNTFTPIREHNRKKKFDIKFSSMESTSLYPLIMTVIFYLILATIFLGNDRLMPYFHNNQAEIDIPLIVLLDEGSSETPSCSTYQRTAPVNDSHNILVDIQMDKDMQQSVEDTASLETVEQRSVSTNTNEIIMQTFELNWYACIPYFVSLPFVFQYFYSLLLDQLTLMDDNLNACYYNMECSFVLGPFQTFNHMFSNIGYLLLGFIFIVLISRRYKYWKYHRSARYSYCPHVFLNIGLMMCLEAFASAFYHICPNPRTFHNDTLFVEITLVLLMVRFYFVRRGGISLSGIFQSITFAISFHFAGNAIKDNIYALGIILTSGLLLLIAFQYHLSFGNHLSAESIPIRNWRKWLGYYWQFRAENEGDKSLAMKKILLACSIACNTVLALLFETSLLQTSYITLHILMLNTAGYFIYYIACKIINGETMLIYAFVYAIASFLLWIVAFYFFDHGRNDWTLTAAQNRAIAEECIMFQYFDYHDIWHFISSLASFFTLLAIAVIDDDIMTSDFDPQLIHIF